MTSALKAPQSCNLKNNATLVLGSYIPLRLWPMAGEADREFTRTVLRLKQRHKDAVEYFIPLADPYLPPDHIVCVVPAHNSRHKYPGIRLLAQHIAARQGRTDGSHILDRHTTTPAMRTGAPRSETIHFESIRVIDRHLIKDKEVILLDDVISTGCSMRACEALLLSAGARSVFCCALSRTVQYV